MRVAAFVAVLPIMVAASAPARLVDHGVRKVSDDGWRIGQAEGSVWNGHGTLVAIDPAMHQGQPWLRLAWSFRPAQLLRGRLAWDLTTDGGAPALLEIGAAGVQVAGFEMHGPARFFLQRVPGPLAQMAWDGDLRVAAEVLACSWQAVCGGRLRASWTSAASEFLPGQVFGDYLAQAEGTAGSFALSWSSSGDSAVRLSGTGSVSRDGQVRLSGAIKGDPALLRRIPAVAGPWVRPTPAADTWELHFP